MFSSTYDVLTSWFVWIRPERPPRDDLIVLERRSRDGYGGGGSVITTSQASTSSGGGGGNESGAAMSGQDQGKITVVQFLFDSALGKLQNQAMPLMVRLKLTDIT